MTMTMSVRPADSIRAEYGDIWATSVGRDAGVVCAKRRGGGGLGTAVRPACWAFTRTRGTPALPPSGLRPEDVIRPAYVTDVTRTDGKRLFPGRRMKHTRIWFDGNILWSYFESDYPWTRLGYTYDWSGGEIGIRADGVFGIRWRQNRNRLYGTPPRSLWIGSEEQTKA